MASLDKYSGSWTLKEATHLARRATFGQSPVVLRQIVSLGIEDTINRLFEPQPMPAHPINVRIDDDADVPIGDTWHDKMMTSNPARFRPSLNAWSMEQYLTKSFNIREKMVLFWHNHFVVADINDPRLTYQYISTIRKNALGNFKDLTSKITIDPAMLIYLNGKDNTKQAPNENYARELLELFTIGKGDLVGPGDYTNYTENDIKEAAKVLTGWIVLYNEAPPASDFRISRHDTSNKQLSNRFNNAILNNDNENEYNNLINIIFGQDAVAEYIIRRLHIWFVGTKIDAEIEQDIIKPLANIIREDNYEISRALKTLLSSEYFYDECNLGNIIKNPLEFITPIYNHFEVEIATTDPKVREQIVLATIYNNARIQQMSMYEAPSVAGWTPYYQEPSYDGIWLNSTTIPARRYYSDILAIGTNIQNTGVKIKIDSLKYLEMCLNASDATSLVDEIVSYIFAFPLAANQKNIIMTKFLAGYTTQQWTDAYIKYKGQPDNETYKLAITSRMTNLIGYLMRMPEYQLH
jgi:hypothetical protein